MNTMYMHSYKNCALKKKKNCALKKKKKLCIEEEKKTKIETIVVLKKVVESGEKEKQQ